MTTRRRQASSLLPDGTEFGHMAGLGSETGRSHLTILEKHLTII